MPGGVTKYNEPARRFYLEERLRNLKMREDEGFEEFFWTRFVPAYDALADMGRKLDEETQVFLLLNALPDSWSGFVEVVCLLGLDMLTLDDVCLKAVCEDLEGCHRADNRQVIIRFGWDKYMQLGDLRAGGKMKDIKEERERLSKLSVQDANANAAPSSVENPKSRKPGGKSNKDEPIQGWILGSSLTFVDANEKIAPSGVQDTRSQQVQPQSSRKLGNRKNEPTQEARVLGSSSSHEEPKGKSIGHGMQDSRSNLQGSTSHLQASRTSRKNEQPEELCILGSSLTFEDANGRSIPPGGQTLRSQPQNSRTNGNSRNKKKTKEMWVKVVDAL